MIEKAALLAAFTLISAHAFAQATSAPTTNDTVSANSKNAHEFADFARKQNHLIPGQTILTDIDVKTGKYHNEKGSMINHNGSMVWMLKNAGLIVYAEPKSSIARTVQPGQILFAGKFLPDSTIGEAYVFKGNCTPAPYAVTGGPFNFQINEFVLTGHAPHREKTGCGIAARADKSDNDTLVFHYGDMDL